MALALLLVGWLLPAVADANPQMARDKRCLNCHAVDRKLVGPAFRDVARRYAGQSDAAARLADKIMRGGGGNWGPVPMPANALTPAEARALAVWVLSTK